MTDSKNRFAMHEDWAVVVLGFLIIALAIGGLLLPIPFFSWSIGAELAGKVLAPG